jgi:hypothetical protein
MRLVFTAELKTQIRLRQHRLASATDFEDGAAVVHGDTDLDHATRRLCAFGT